MSRIGALPRFCGAGVPPAAFLAPHLANPPAGRRRHKSPASGAGSFGTRWLLSFFFLIIFIAGCGKHGSETIVVGSKNFTEQIVLGEMFAQQIEAHSALRVERRLNLGGTFICHDALVHGKIALYPEYTGTSLTAVLKDPPQNDPAAVLRQVQEEYRTRFNVEVMPPLGFNNAFAMVVRGDDAGNLHLRTISDVAAYAPKWRAGFGYEFMERPDGYRGWAAAYGLHFAGAPRILDLGLLYRALADKQVDLVAGNSTDGTIESLHMVALEDDRHYFPPYEAVPLVRRDTLEKHPEVRDAIGALAGKISVSEMRAMNYAVDGEHRDPADVVRAFRQSKGL
jgi:osmoprotectant transport system substrate-binding protein